MRASPSENGVTLIVENNLERAALRRWGKMQPSIHASDTSDALVTVNFSEPVAAGDDPGPPPWPPRVGDWVKVNDPRSSWHGSAGVVSKILDWVYVRFRGEGADFGYATSQLEPWVPRVGERVRLKDGAVNGRVKSISGGTAGIEGDRRHDWRFPIGSLEPAFDEFVENPEESAKERLPEGWARDGDGVLAGPEGMQVRKAAPANPGSEFHVTRQVGQFYQEQPRPIFFATEAEALARARELLKTAKTFRVPAIGQRVRIWPEGPNCEAVVVRHEQRGAGVSQFWLVAKKGGGSLDWCNPEELIPIGPDPRFVEITIREL